PLPFFSYGGSSLLSPLMGVRLMMNVSMRRAVFLGGVRAKNAGGAPGAAPGVRAPGHGRPRTWNRPPPAAGAPPGGPAAARPAATPGAPRGPVTPRAYAPSPQTTLLMALTSWAFGTAPTICSFTSPPENRIKFGIPRTP